MITIHGTNVLDVTYSERSRLPLPQRFCGKSFVQRQRFHGEEWFTCAHTLCPFQSSRPSSSEGRRNGKAAQATQEVASVSAEAVNVAKRLGVTVGKRRVPVTILINNVSRSFLICL